MPLDQAFRLSSILLAASAFAGLTLASSLSALVLLLGAFALLISLFHVLQISRPKRILPVMHLSSHIWNHLLVLSFVYFWIDLLWISQDLLPAGVHFLIALMVNKLFNLHQRRDFLHLYAISLMAVLASATLTSDLWYATVFLVYLLTAVWTLLLYHLTQETSEEFSSPTSPEPAIHRMRYPTGAPTRITMRFFWTTNGMAVGAFCLTLSIFFALPRIGVGFFQKNRGDTLRTSGFSENVDLGVIGAVKQDPSIVMRVETPEEPAPRTEKLYLRGIAYDRYNGRSWNHSFPQRRMAGEISPGTFKISGGPARKPGAPSLRQDILLEALDTSVLFGVPFPDLIAGEFLSVQADVMGAAYLSFPPTSRFQYTVYSRDTQVASDDRLAASFSYPNFIREHFLQVPALSPRIGELAREVTGRATNPFEMVVAIKQHLLKDYQYSLDVGAARPARPLEEFLFARKTGYCEHYATAMVVLLRSVGIPSRLVTGFLATEWNGYGNYYTVRQKDAHAWVEVFFPRSGWITMDPTPPIMESTSDVWGKSFVLMLDSLQLRWDRLIVQYSSHDQMAMVRGLRETSEHFRDNIIGSLAPILNPLFEGASRMLAFIRQANVPQLGVMLSVIVLGITLFVLLLLKFPWKLFQVGKLHTNQQTAAVQIYDRMLRLAKSRGVRKTPSTAPIEFVELIGKDWQVATSMVRELTDLYCRVRFGKAALSQEDILNANRLLAMLSTLPRTT
ncbi:MAG: transglutaminase TgpA family protein [Nitrospiraceae bacterium]